MNRTEEIRHNTELDTIFMNHKPTCNTTHYAGCDCQIQRYIREKQDLLSHIDTLTERVRELEEEVGEFKNTLWETYKMTEEVRGSKGAERRMRIVSISERMLRGELRMPREISVSEAYEQLKSNEDTYPFPVWVFKISKEEEMSEGYIPLSEQKAILEELRKLRKENEGLKRIVIFSKPLAGYAKESGAPQMLLDNYEQALKELEK